MNTLNNKLKAKGNPENCTNVSHGHNPYKELILQTNASRIKI
jgi:hypothetical protein